MLFSPDKFKGFVKSHKSVSLRGQQLEAI